ncbi:MAG: peptide ABC transporter substrate-binding protein [Anaerolineaceae bacterium]|nr:peptide ABC transporter substrate-binding protein [Anaerolineaceae bacterium]
MRKFRWQFLLVFTTLLVVGLLIFFQQTSPLKKVVNTPSPVTGGVYTEGLVGKFNRLNPMLAFHNQADKDINHLIFSSLIKFDSTGRPVADLAESWSVSEDATRYNIKLKPNVLWHNGVPFTAQDVVFTASLLQSRSPLLPKDLQEFWPLVQVNAINDFEVAFLLPEPYAPFIDYLSFQILPANQLGNLSLEQIVDHPFNLAPIGTGPYVFDKLKVNEGLISEVHLKPFDRYFDGRAFIEEIIFKYFASDQAALAAYIGGEVDGISSVSAQTLPGVLAQGGLNLYSAQQPRLTMVFLNLLNENKPFLKDENIRKALMAAINRQGIVDQVLKGQAVLAQGPIMSNNWAYYPGQEAWKYDPDKAKQIINSLEIRKDEIGYMVTKDGAQVSMVLLTEDEEAHRAMAEIVKQNWGAQGIAVEVQSLPLPLLMEQLKAHTYDAALVDINLSGTPDPDPYPFWGQAMIQNGQNYAGWDDRTASDYLEQARITTDMSLRAKLYRNFQIYFQEKLPALPLFYPIYNYAVRETIKDVSFGPMNDPSDRFTNISRWYILSAKNQDGSTPSGE